MLSAINAQVTQQPGEQTGLQRPPAGNQLVMIPQLALQAAHSSQKSIPILRQIHLVPNSNKQQCIQLQCMTHLT